LEAGAVKKDQLNDPAKWRCQYPVPDPSKTIRLGSRKSQLALAQASMVESALRESAGSKGPIVEIVSMTVQGDRAQGTPEESVPDKKKWVVDLEQALLRGEIDAAVHSGKDVPSNIEPGTRMLPVLQRGDPRDLLIRRGDVAGKSLSELPDGSVVATASLRRKAFLLAANPRLKVIDLRGNVPTRLEKLRMREDLSAIVVAAAGIDRLGIRLPDELSATPLDTEVMLPAAHQGILAAQFRADRRDMAEFLAGITNESCLVQWEAERAFTGRIGASCSSCIGIYASIRPEGGLRLHARAFSREGDSSLQDEEHGPFRNAGDLGVILSDRMIANGLADML
jgi:hydroxymethylbilane synthase